MNLASRDYQEKRNFIRMKIEAPIAVTSVSNGESVQGICHNLSGGGMLISIPSPIPVGTTLEATVRSSHGHSPMLKALAQVNRLQDSATIEGSYQLGLEIVQLLD